MASEGYRRASDIDPQAHRAYVNFGKIFTSDWIVEESLGKNIPEALELDP